MILGLLIIKCKLWDPYNVGYPYYLLCQGAGLAWSLISRIVFFSYHCMSKIGSALHLRYHLSIMKSLIKDFIGKFCPKKWPTVLLCVNFLEIVRGAFPQVRILHYMDDILLAYFSTDLLQKAFSMTIKVLNSKGLIMAPDKIQTGELVSFLGSKV